MEFIQNRIDQIKAYDKKKGNKNKYISDVYKENPSWVYWFVDVKKSNFEDYLREYIKCKVISNMSH